jgi:hypothetical protein
VSFAAAAHAKSICGRSLPSHSANPLQNLVLLAIVSVLLKEAHNAVQQLLCCCIRILFRPSLLLLYSSTDKKKALMTMSKIGDVEADCYRTFLEDLVRREQREAYQKEDYLSRRWQQDLWEDVASAEKIRFASKSPSSVIPSAHQSPPSDLCVDWREKICEWKYKVVDCFDLDREVVSISMFFLDKYLEKHFVNEEVSLCDVHSLQITLPSSLLLTLEKYPTHLISLAVSTSRNVMYLSGHQNSLSQEDIHEANCVAGQRWM